MALGLTPRPRTIVIGEFQIYKKGFDGCVVIGVEESESRGLWALANDLLTRQSSVVLLLRLVRDADDTHAIKRLETLQPHPPLEALHSRYERSQTSPDVSAKPIFHPPAFHPIMS